MITLKCLPISDLETKTHKKLKNEQNNFNFISPNPIFISCSNEEPTETTYTNELKTGGTLLFNQSTNKFCSKTSKTVSENTTEHNVELSFISENPIPVFDSNEE